MANFNSAKTPKTEKKIIRREENYHEEGVLKKLPYKHRGRRVEIVKAALLQKSSFLVAENTNLRIL